MAMADEKHTDTTNVVEAMGNIDERIQALAKEAPPFYTNRNLTILYLLMIPGCLVPAITLGFDSAMMNGLQAVPAWEECTFAQIPLVPGLPF